MFAAPARAEKGEPNPAPRTPPASRPTTVQILRVISYTLDTNQPHSLSPCNPVQDQTGELLMLALYREQCCGLVLPHHPIAMPRTDAVLSAARGHGDVVILPVALIVW